MTDAWWTISGEALLGALRRVHEGDDPDVVYAELYANSDSTRIYEDTGCLGHPAAEFDPMGETVYCDGTCR